MTKSMIIALLFASGLATAQTLRYEQKATRERLLNLVEQPPAHQLEFSGELPASGPRRIFLEHYRDHIFPKLEWLRGLGIRYSSFNLLRDSGSADNEAEMKQWTERFEAVAEEYNEFLVDENWTKTLTEWAKLAEGLDGQLPALAKRLSRERELESFPPESKPILNEIITLKREYEDALRTAPANDDLASFGEERVTVRREFKKGELTFAEAQKRMRDIYSTRGYQVLGHQAAQAKGENLNRIALLRTQLAKQKGFPTWAAYTLELSGQGYSPAYRGTQNQRQFLKRYLAALKPLEERLIADRMHALGLDPATTDLRAQDVPFLSAPALEQLQPYFPNEKISEIWQTVLGESGFKPETMQQILLDDEFRDGKNRSMAYLSGVLPPFNHKLVIDPDKLNFAEISRAPGELHSGLVYILQSYTGGGVMDLKTAFHEGGHATDKILKFKNEPVDEAYGYIEVPSMTSERFTHDADVLYHHAVPIDGKKPSLEEIHTLLENFHKNSVFGLSGLASGSLLDLELWDFDYTAEGAETFLQRIEHLSHETENLKYADVPSQSPFFYYNIATTHFTSGNVRNIGYDYAEIASRMMAEYLSNELEKVSGRRSWYQQPEFARIYEEKFVSVGWKKPFPENIETITGRKFDPEVVVASLGRRIAGETACEQRLDRKATNSYQ